MKKTVITVVKFIVSFGILFFIARKVGAQTLWETLRKAHVWPFVAAILAYFAVQGLSAYRWYILLKPLGLKIGYPKILSLYFLGMYFNLFLPTAIGGDAVRIYYLHKEARRLSHSTASVFLDRDLGMGALLIMATIVAAFAGTSINGIALAPIFALISVAFILANLAIFYRPTYNLLHRALSLTKMKSVDEKVESLFNSVNAYRGQGKVLTTALILSLIIQVGGVYSNILVAQSIGLETANGWFDFLVFIPAISLISMNPISVAGTGWREYSYKVLFESVGATEPQAVALGLLWLGVMVATSLPGGIIYILKGNASPNSSDDVESDITAVNNEILEASKT